MSENTKAALAAGLAAGYVLGRGRKAKLAMAVAGFLATKKLQAKPQQLLAAGAERLGDSGQLTQLVEQVRGEVLTVGREALKAVADRRLGGFADALADRTKSLNQVLEAGPEAAKGARGEEEEEEGEEEAGPEEEAGRGTGRQRRGSRTAQTRAKSGGTRRESQGSQAPAKKAAKKAPARKTAKKSTRKPAEPSRARR